MESDLELPAMAALMQILDLQRQLQDGHDATHRVSSETLTVVQPLSALLQLLDRPLDQRQELGERLSETLHMLSGQLQQLIAQGERQAERTRRMQVAIAELSKAQQAQTGTLLKTARRLERLEAALFAEA